MVRSRSAWFMTATAAALYVLMMPDAVVRAQGADLSICTTVKCIANGDAECNRATSTCPTCMYTISGGYSCYDKIDGACPYPDLLMTCPPKATPTLAPTPAPTPKPAPVTTPVTELPATVVPPQIDTPPATTAVSSATSPPATATPSPASADGGSETAGTHPHAVQNNPTSSSTAASPGSSSSSLRNGSGSGGPSTSAARSTTSDSTSSTSAPSPSAQAMDSSSGIANSNDKVSSMYVNIGVIVAAVSGVAIVAIFIVRRMKKRREEGFLKTPEESNKQFNLQVERRQTPSHGRRGSGGAAGVGAGAEAAGFAAGGGAVRGHRAESDSDVPSLLSMASLDSSTAEFANHHYPYGLPSQFGLPSDASSYARSSNNSHASSTISSGTFGGYNQSGRGAPRPQAIQEGDEFTHHSKRKQSVGAAAAAAAVGGARTPGKNSSRPVHKPIYHETVRRKSSAISLTSGNTYEDEYDIVHPGALKDADRRNTETLVQDGRFQSNFSEQDVRSLQQDRFFASKEHEI